jgi:hypothetical protein
VGDGLTPEMKAALALELEGIRKEAGIAGTALKALGGLGERAAASLGRTGETVAKAPKAIWGWAKSQPKQFQEAGGRLLHPIEGLKKGWGEMSPGAMVRAGERKAEGHLTGQTIPLRDLIRQKNITGTAEELSRRGWTGEGPLTKYLPVGMKSMQAGFMGMSVPDVIAASKREPSPTGEGGLYETLGTHGLGNLAFAGAGRIGMLPAMGMYWAASKAGGGVGRIIDRLRGGATLPQAMTAPSPEEAASQLQNIQRYYG